MNVFEMEKELNDLIKHGQELIEKLKQENSDDTIIGKLGWASDDSPDEKQRCFILERIDPHLAYPYMCSIGEWKYFKPLTPEEIEQYTGYKVEV